MMTQVFRVHGFPKDIVSDRGPQFVSKFWLRILQPNWSHSQSDIRIPSRSKWPDRTPQPTVGNRPPMGGTQESLNMEQTPDNEKEASVPSAYAMVQRCRSIWAAARQVLIRQGDGVKRNADRRRRPAPNYHPGQRVWLSAKDLNLKVASKKLAPRLVGPFPVTRNIGPAAVRLRLPQSLRVHPTFHISQVKPSDSILWPAMDSAEAERLSEVLRTQEARLNCQEEFQTAMAANMGQLSSQIQELLGQLCRQSPATLTPPSPAIPEVPASSGGASCKLAPPTKYAGRAKAWALAEWSRNSTVCETIVGFQTALTRTFDPLCSSREKAPELSTLRQGLSAEIQDLLVPLDLPTSLDALIALAIRTDNRRTQLRRYREERQSGRDQHTAPRESRWPTPHRVFPEKPHLRPDEEPMQLGRARLSPEERLKRRQEGRCFYCREAGHLVNSCPSKRTQGAGIQKRKTRCAIQTL
ncbi:uncharacterized protein LOC119027253 isoform X2 [Acanthopagrus latus]|uniref:uncharacterized protein LOC119027253 isoform X2 n=1 Tax=Acanthopagrus latus TaxID=8177 RepID=UPI00187BF49F|nr:uncharacterized protein LOC119027253 isoform X2 [Acanthopagrus latus]